MNEALLRHLLTHPETYDVEFKRQFPEHFFTRGDERQNHARAELIRDVAGVANAPVDRPGYLIYGVQDRGGRRVPFAASPEVSLDDATLDQLLTRYLEPVPEISYGEFRLDGVLVGLMRIGRVPDYPHVIRESLSGRIHEGQVFVRQGTRIHVAGHAELRRMFDGAAPYVSTSDTTEFSALVQSLRESGWHTAFIPHQQVDERLGGGWTFVHWPGTRRRIARPANFDGTNLQYLIKRPVSQDSRAE
ncbi:helix-turn-helix domain-containing protein [Deinococcus yunweiensis]|uniref:AlbA family DNA-binding domain-containing protein n=1 Tax=Deinococcus yunweiensis TaxID=367282 RepID=UPI00398EBE66